MFQFQSGRKIDLGAEESPLDDCQRGMAFVIGCDPGFKYKRKGMWIYYPVFRQKVCRVWQQMVWKVLEKNDYDYACNQFRSVTMLSRPENADAYYYYWQACTRMLESSNVRQQKGPSDFWPRKQTSHLWSRNRGIYRQVQRQRILWAFERGLQ